MFDDRKVRLDDFDFERQEKYDEEGNAISYRDVVTIFLVEKINEEQMKTELATYADPTKIPESQNSVTFLSTNEKGLDLVVTLTGSWHPVGTHIRNKNSGAYELVKGFRMITDWKEYASG